MPSQNLSPSSHLCISLLCVGEDGEDDDSLFLFLLHCHSKQTSGTDYTKGNTYCYLRKEEERESRHHIHISLSLSFSLFKYEQEASVLLIYPYLLRPHVKKNTFSITKHLFIHSSAQ